MSAGLVASLVRIAGLGRDVPCERKSLEVQDGSPKAKVFGQSRNDL